MRIGLTFGEFHDLTDKKPVVKEWYDGYRFGNEEIYCPWDVINYCYDVQANPKLKPKTYWMNTSGNAFIKTLIERAPRGTEQMQIEERDYTAVLRRYRFKEIRTYGIAFWDKECMVKEKKVK